MKFKKLTKEEKDLCRIVTPEFRVSYPHVFTPQSPTAKDKKKFSITMLFPKDLEMAGLAPDKSKRTIKGAIKNAKLVTFGPKENWPEELLSPLTDGDDPKHKDKLGYKGHWVLKATSNEDQRPTVVGPSNDEYGRLVELTKPAELYPGCYARANIFAYPWEFMGKVGIGFILDHVQKLREGEPFGGKKAAEAVFSPLEASQEDDGDDEDNKPF